MSRMTGSQQPEEQVTIETELSALNKLMNTCLERGLEVREVLGIQEEGTAEKEKMAVERQPVEGVVGTRIAYLRGLQGDARRVQSNLDAILEVVKHI